MDETPPTLPSQPVTEPSPTMSLGARLLNVFAIPGDVFAEVKAMGTCISNWLVPAVLTAIAIGITYSITMSQPAIRQKITEQQERMLDKVVQSGKMSRADADKQLEMMKKFSGPAFMVATGVMSGVIGGFLRVFWWAFFLWVLGRFLLKERFKFSKAMEVSGLAGMIGVLGLIVTMLLQINFSDLTSSPSLALLVDKFDEHNPRHLFLGLVNVFNIWQAIVLAVALSRLCGVPFSRAAFVFLPFWLVFQLTIAGFSLAVASVMGG
jgi:hypothetical protein